MCNTSACPPEPVIFSQVAALEQPWKLLFDESGRSNPFLSWEWHQSWTDVFQGRLQPMVLGAFFPDGRLAGLLPLQQVRHLEMRQLEFLSCGSGADELDCLIHPQASPSLAGQLLQHALSTPWQLLRLETVNRDSLLAAELASSAPPATLRIEAGETLPYLPLPDSFETLLLQHSSNFRAEIRRRRRNLERRGGPVLLHCAECPQEVAAALHCLFGLHNSRRQQKHEAGIFEDPRLREFHFRVAERLAHQKMTRVYVMYVAGEPVAALYGFVARRRFFYFQSGLAPESGHLSPGTVLMSLVIEDCIRRGLQQFEFLRGSESYKSRWTACSRPTVNVMMARGLVGRTYLRLREAHRQWIRTEAPATGPHPETMGQRRASPPAANASMSWPDPSRRDCSMPTSLASWSDLEPAETLRSSQTTEEFPLEAISGSSRTTE